MPTVTRCSAARQSSDYLQVSDPVQGVTRQPTRWATGGGVAIIESEWITWELCPRCGHRAAVGWSDDGRFVDPIEFDCHNGCRLSISELVRTFPPMDAPVSAGRAVRVEHFPVDDLRHASEVACDAVRRGAMAITIAAGLGGATRVTIVWRRERS